MRTNLLSSGALVQVVKGAAKLTINRRGLFSGWQLAVRGGGQAHVAVGGCRTAASRAGSRTIACKIEMAVRGGATKLTIEW
jgi:hypothetical protein